MLDLIGRRIDLTDRLEVITASGLTTGSDRDSDCGQLLFFWSDNHNGAPYLDTGRAILAPEQAVAGSSLSGWILDC